MRVTVRQDSEGKWSIKARPTRRSEAGPQSAKGLSRSQLKDWAKTNLPKLETIPVPDVPAGG